MALRRTLGPVLLSALVIALISPFSPVKLPSAGAEESASSGARSLFFQVRGTVDRKGGGSPERFVYEPDVFDMNNQKVGTVTHDVMFTSPTTLDLVSRSTCRTGTFTTRVWRPSDPTPARTAST